MLVVLEYFVVVYDRQIEAAVPFRGSVEGTEPQKNMQPTKQQYFGGLKLKPQLT